MSRPPRASSAASNEQLLDELHDTLAHDPALAHSIAHLLAKHSQRRFEPQVEYSVGSNSASEGSSARRVVDKGKQREQRIEDSYGHERDTDSESDLTESSVESSSAEERGRDEEGRPLMEREKAARSRTTVSSDVADLRHHRRDRMHAARQPPRADSSLPSLPNPLNPSAYIVYPPPSDALAPEARGKKPLVVLPFLVPSFDRSGLPSTPSNPYLPPPVLAAEARRHRSRIYLPKTLSLAARQRAERQKEGVDGKNSFFFPLLIGLMLVVLPLTVLGIVGALLVDWRGGVQAGWSGAGR